MLQRLIQAFGLALLALAAAGCGGSGDERSANDAAAPENAAAVLVTTDCGKEVVLERTEVPAGQTAMQAVDRVAEIETDSGGKFVTAIEGIEQNTDEQLAWLFYVNGQAAQKGAAEIKLKPGDVEWWDLHNWEESCAIPAEAR